MVGLGCKHGSAWLSMAAMILQVDGLLLVCSGCWKVLSHLSRAPSPTGDIGWHMLWKACLRASFLSNWGMPALASVTGGLPLSLAFA